MMYVDILLAPLIQSKRVKIGGFKVVSSSAGHKIVSQFVDILDKISNSHLKK